MFNIKNLNIYLEKDLRHLIKDFSLSFTSDDKVAIIGEEGNGKSTLFKTLVSKSEVEKYAKISGEISFSDISVGYLGQEAAKKNLEVTTFDYFQNEVGEDINFNRLYILLNDFSLEDYFYDKNVKIKNLSGGEQVKFFLICTLLKNPELLLLDEPSNNLDEEALNWLENFIITSKIPILFISHDVKLIENCATMLVHFEQVKRKTEFRYSVSYLNYEDYFENRKNEQLLQDKKAKKQKEIHRKKEEKFQKVYQKVKNSMNQEVRNPAAAKNLKDKMRSLKSQEKRLTKEKNNLLERPDYEEEIFVKFSEVDVVKGKDLLNIFIENLEINDRQIIKDAFFEIQTGEKVFITGRNGIGKTTLLNYLINKLEDHKVEFGYMPQDYEKIFKNYSTPLEFLDDGVIEISTIYTYLGSVNLTRDEMLHSLEELSGGQKAKLYLTRLILRKSKLLILDEPTRNLSMMSVRTLINELKVFKGTIIAISHDRKFVDELADKVYHIKDRKLELL